MNILLALETILISIKQMKINETCMDKSFLHLNDEDFSHQILISIFLEFKQYHDGEKFSRNENNLDFPRNLFNI